MHPELLQQLAAAPIRDLITEAAEARSANEARHARGHPVPAQRPRPIPAITANPAGVMEPCLARRGTRTR